MFATPNKQKKGKFTRDRNDQQGNKLSLAGQEEILDDDVDYGRQTFPVARLPDDFDGIPLDGEQYLAVVRQEASTHPAVFRAQHNPYVASNLNVASTSSLKLRQPILPSQEWRKTFVLRFKAMREALAAAPTAPITNPRTGRLPRRGNAKDWYHFIHCRAPSIPIVVDSDDAHEPVQVAMDEDDEAGNAAAQATWTPEEALLAVEAERQPSPALMRRFTTAHLLDALTIFPYWFTQPQPRPPNIPGTMTPVLYALHGNWLFAILATLDHRLTSDEISTLRTLARSCIAAIALHRAKRAALGRLGAHPEDVLQGEQSAWSVIASVAGVWGQHDMWDDAETSLVNGT